MSAPAPPPHPQLVPSQGPCATSSPAPPARAAAPQPTWRWVAPGRSVRGRALPDEGGESIRERDGEAPEGGKSGGSAGSKKSRGGRNGTGKGGEPAMDRSMTKALQSGWLYKAEIKQELRRIEEIKAKRRKLGWARIYSEDWALRDVDRRSGATDGRGTADSERRQRERRIQRREEANREVDANEMEDFLDSWAVDIVDHVSDWDAGDKADRTGWGVSGSEMKDRVARGRDPYLRPITDVRSWYDRINPDEESVDAGLRLEMRVNEWETRQAAKFAALLFVVPFIVSSSVRWLMIDPGFELLLENNPSVFALSDRQKVKGAHLVQVRWQPPPPPPPPCRAPALGRPPPSGAPPRLSGRAHRRPPGPGRPLAHRTRHDPRPRRDRPRRSTSGDCASTRALERPLP